MKVYFDYHTYRVSKPVITTGVFDGVHKGHREILKRLTSRAEIIQGEPVVVTFWPHPRLVLKQDTSIKLLNTLEEKLSLLETAGVQHVVVIPFSEEFSALSPGQFIEEIMVKKLNVNHLIIGFNHHFGKGREGNFDTMSASAKHFGFTLEKLDAQMVENEKVSSTLIREALNSGDVKSASKYLGYNYMITGKVVEGKKIGRTIGFPTANINLNHDFKLIPKEGVYAIEVNISGKLYPAMLNIGYRPTIDLQPVSLSIEAHVINFEGDLYQKDLTICFKKRIREEIKFAGIEELIKQLNSDKEEVIKILGA